MKTQKVAIDPFKYYSMLEMVNDAVFPFCGKDIRTYRTTIAKDIAKGGASVLKPVIRGSGRGKRYLIKGNNIRQFISLVESGRIAP